MPAPCLHAVTGAFGYSGRHIAQRLLDAGHQVITLTNSAPTTDPFGGRVRVFPLDFADGGALTASLRGVSVLHNTYWVRYAAAGVSFVEAVANSKRLLAAAMGAGVRRVVHVSITNPAPDSPLPYFRGKAEVEQALVASGLSHAILRPAVLFGGESSILINNICWALRRFPVFGVFGAGQYRLQPIHVDDLAALAVEQSARPENAVVQAIGPETFTYRELARTLGRLIGWRRPVIGVPPRLGFALAWLTGHLLGDVMLTWDEVRGLMQDRLCVDGAAPAGTTRLTDWVAGHADELGRHYASELARRRRHARLPDPARPASPQP